MYLVRLARSLIVAGVLIVASVPRLEDPRTAVNALKLAAHILGCPEPIVSIVYPDAAGQMEITVRCD